MKRDRFIREVRINWEKIEPDSYLREIPALRDVGRIALDNNIVFLVGENGTGKSTLLEGIAVAYGFNPEGGTKNYNFSTHESHSELFGAMTLVKGTRRVENGYFLRAESFYNVATKAEEYRETDLSRDYYKQFGGRSLHKQSHGESFLSLIQGTFGENGVFILDEPEAALSPQRQLTLLLYIHKLAEKGAQFLIATHSPILLGTPGAKILSFDEGVMHECSYEETESYQVTEMFINSKEYLLHRLLSEE